MPPSNNGKSHETDLLDRVLEGQSPEVKMRVLEMVVRLGIDPRDELFLVMIALNHLQLLILDAPQEWQELFLDFKTELDQWTESNLAVLDTLIRKAKTEEMLAKSCQQLVYALSNLTTSSHELMRQLQISTKDSQESWQTQNSSWKDSVSILKTLQHDLTALRERFLNNPKDLNQSLSASPMQIQRLWTALGVAGVTVLIFGWQLWGTVADTNQRVKWMLGRQIRQECLTGRKAKSSLECVGIR